jgi:hypothetical protein
MDFESEAEKREIPGIWELQLELAATAVAIPKCSADVAMAGLQFGTAADWAALKQEIHQKLRELESAGDGCFQGVRSDLEMKIAALEESFRMSDLCSNRMARHKCSADRQRNSSGWAGSKRTDGVRMQETQKYRLPRLIA